MDPEQNASTSTEDIFASAPREPKEIPTPGAEFLTCVSQARVDSMLDAIAKEELTGRWIHLGKHFLIFCFQMRMPTRI